MDSSKQIKWGAVISYLAIALNIVSGLIYTPWMIETVGKDQYGLYSIALSIINIFLLDFGIGSAVTRFLSNFYANGEKEKATVFMGIVYKVFFIISILIAVCLFIFYFFIDIIYTKLTPSEIVIFKHLFIIVAAYSVISFPCMPFKGILMANEKFIAVKLTGLAQKILDIALIIVLLLLKQGIYAIVLVHAFTNTLFNAIRYLIVRFDTKQKSDLSAWDGKQAKSLFNYSVWVTVMSIAQRCVFNVMPSLIAALIGSVEVTVFSLAATLENYVYFFSDAINGMFMPKISKILVSDDSKKRLNALMCKVGKFHVYTIGLIIVGFAAIGSQFVDIWLGDGNINVYYCAILLMLPSLVDVPQQVAKTSLLALNIVKEQAIIYLIMAVINIVLSFVLVPFFGAFGAAIAVCVSYMFRTAMFNLLYKKRLPIDLRKYFKETYVKWIIPAVASGIVGYAVGGLFNSVSIISFGVAGCAMVACYGVLLFTLCFDKQTKTKLLSKIIKH